MLIDFRQLFPRYDIKPKGVLHVGANVGEEAPVYNELGIEYVLWIEGNPETYERLSDNIHNLCSLSNEKYYTGHSMACYIVGDENKKNAVLHISNNGSQSSSILDLCTHKIAHPEVHYIGDVTNEMIRLDSILGENDKHFDFLNIDLQGAELMALRGLGDKLHQFKWAYLEVNKQELYKGCALVEDIDMYMLGFGFRRVETMWVGNTGWGDALYIK